MIGFDIAVLLIVGLAGVFGFMRGFVHEVLALLAWVVALVAIRFGHATLAIMLRGVIGTTSGAEVLAFAILLVVPYFAVRMIAKWAGGRSRNSVLGPIDRVLGFGFGALKGLIVVVLGFSIVMLGYDLLWGSFGRPAWVTSARTYPVVNAASNELVTMLAERRRAAAASAPSDAAADSTR